MADENDNVLTQYEKLLDAYFEYVVDAETQHVRKRHNTYRMYDLIFDLLKNRLRQREADCLKDDLETETGNLLRERARESAKNMMSRTRSLVEAAESETSKMLIQKFAAQEQALRTASDAEIKKFSDARDSEVNKLKAQIIDLQRALSPAGDFPSIELWQLVHANDWDDDRLSFSKALACALIARLAYLHVPTFELTDDTRYKLVPCAEYQDIVRRKLTFSIAALMLDWDFGPPILVDTKNLVLVGVRFPKVIFLGIRGTAHLYDQFVNGQFWGLRFSQDIPGGYFHHGFASAIAEAFGSLHTQLRQMGADKTPIYVAGHSLGGAMGAILHERWGMNSGSNAALTRTRACYTFGMPRYANAAALEKVRSPHHFFNTKDAIPTVPPKWAGYADVNGEIATDRTNGRKRLLVTNAAGCLYSWLSQRGMFRHHSMELYERDIRGMNL